MTPRLNGWTPLTSRLLQEGGSSAWNVIDGAMGQDVCTGIQNELAQSKVLDKLMPARTIGEAQAWQLLSLIMVQNDPAVMIRGDKNLYISREFRNDPRFSERHPNLNRLIETVQTTLVEALSSTLQLDITQTSVQLAVYPGDGRSGYIRHCDRGQASCREDTRNSSEMGRIVTAIYYLTDADWSATKDAGHLRLFHSDSYTTDVTPYRDRLVIFRADSVEHQVLPSQRRPRTAITMWFYGNVLAPLSTSLSMKNGEATESTRAMEMTRSSSIKSCTEFSVPSLEGPPALITFRPESGNNEKGLERSIFVAISSYRDSETIPTLRSLFSEAQYPNRIFVGLMLQLDDNHDEKIWSQVESVVKENDNQIRYLRIAAKDALGPCYARALCQSLYRREDYFLQIDSHMRLRRNWDSYLIQLQQHIVSKRNDDRVILTTYPVGYTLPNNIPNETRGTLLVPWKFDDSGLLRQRGRLLKPRFDPVPCHLMAAGFFFGPGRMVQEVPYDPTLQQLFFGEELSMAVRFFTHGYDCYAPPETICYHLWSRTYRPTQQAASPSEIKQRAVSLDIVRQQLLGQYQGLSYGLGTRRSVKDFAKALRIDFTTQRFLDDAFENGGLLSEDFVPDDATMLFPDESLELKVASLDLNARLLIAKFLPEKSTLE